MIGGHLQGSPGLPFDTNPHAGSSHADDDTLLASHDRDASGRPPGQPSDVTKPTNTGSAMAKKPEAATSPIETCPPWTLTNDPLPALVDSDAHFHHENTVELACPSVLLADDSEFPFLPDFR